MARPRRLTRRFPARMTEAAYRRLRVFAAEAGIEESEALSFVFENWGSITDPETLGHRLRLHKAMLSDRRAKEG